MSKKPNKQEPLRVEPEAQIACAPSKEFTARPAEELLNELWVNQAELEEQNEELRRAQAAIEESRDRYVNLYDFAPVGYLTINRNGTIDEINLTCAALLGVERNKLIHRSFARFIADDDRDRWHQLFPGTLQHDEHQGCEMTMQRSDGSLFQARLDYMWLSRVSVVPQLRITLTDITERKHLEKEAQERRREMDELQKLHVAAQTASAIAHELNQPLLAIASYCKAALLMLKAEKPDFHEICNAIEGSERQAHRAGQSIREMLDYLNSKEFPIEDFDLNQEIIDALDTVRSENELQFHSALRLEERLPLVRANRTHVRKALFNLLHNGIEAMHESGVPMPAITVTVRTSTDDNVAQVTVQDNGPGFRKEDAQRLFEPFFTTKADGFGMGLSISRSLIEANDGQLWVDPQQGHGAVFHLTLPFAT